MELAEGFLRNEFVAFILRPRLFAVFITIFCKALTILITVITRRFITLAHNVLGAVPVATASAGLQAIFVGRALFVAFDGVGASIVDAATGLAFELMVACVVGPL